MYCCSSTTLRVERKRTVVIFQTTGTLGVLRAAALRQLVDLPVALTRLAATNFRVSQALIEELLAEDSERKRHTDNSAPF